MMNTRCAVAALVGIVSLAGCGMNSDSATSRRARSSDGVPIVYDVRGSGETTLVFVHCWACDRSFWREQLDFFAENYRVVSLDLAGHGESGSQRDEWTLSSLGRDVEAVVEDLALERFVVVGHSMGAPVSLEVARILPDRVSGVLCVDSLHNAELVPPEFTANQIIEGLRGDFATAMDALVRSGFREDADPDVVAWVRDKAVAANPEVAIVLIDALLDNDLKRALADASVPIRCINSAIGLATNVEANRRYGDFDAVILDAGGHFQHLESPARFNSEMSKLLNQLH